MTKRVYVSLSGVDGAGKSTLIEALRADLAQDYTVEVLWNPLLFWGQGALNKIPERWRSQLGQGRPIKSERNGPAATAAPPRRRPRALAKLFWYVIGTGAAVSAALSLRHRHESAASEIVILDRFRIDTIMKLQYWYGDVSRSLLSRIVLMLAPAPAIEFYLRVPGEVAYARKAEQWSEKQLVRHVALYDAAARDAHAVVLDGEQSREALTKEVVAQVRAALDGRR
jgi:thymidylate kinase